MSIWETHRLTERVLEILDSARPHEADHPFGQPFLSGYQLALELDRRHPEVRRELRLGVGGEGTGQHASLASYLAGELSKQIRRQGRSHPVEAVLLWRGHTRFVRYRDGNGDNLDSTVSAAGMDMSLFRRRVPVDGATSR